MIRPRDNPFNTDRLHALLRYRLADGDWEGLLARLAAMDYRAALVGPEGRGKSTLMRELAGRLESDGWTVLHLQLRVDQRLLAGTDWPIARRTLGPTTLVCLDGAEQLSWLAWHRFRRASRRAGGLLIASHRPGLLPTLLDCRTTPVLLRDLAETLLAGSGLAPEVDFDALFARHDGNVRLCLRELYDRCSYLDAPVG